MNNTKSERLLNLLILLLVSRSFVTKDRIRDVIDDYRRGSDEAFEKMFERDKDELRSLGIPIEVGHLDAFFDDEVGLPDQARRLRAARGRARARRGGGGRPRRQGLAARRARRRHLAGAAQAEGGRPPRSTVAALDVAQPRLVADEPAFDAVWEATQ